VVFYAVSTPFKPPPPPSRKSETEVVFCRVSTPFGTPPPPSRAKARRRWLFNRFRPRSSPHHLPRVQKRDGGGLLCGFDPVRAPPPPSCTRARRRWRFVGFRPLSGSHHLARKSEWIRRPRATTRTQRRGIIPQPRTTTRAQPMGRNPREGRTHHWVWTPTTKVREV